MEIGNDVKGFVHKMMSDENVSGQEVADRIGVSRQSLHQTLTRGKTMKVDTLMRILDVLGYKIIVEKK